MKVSLNKYTKKLITIGIVSMIFLIVVTFLLGDVSGYQAKELFTKSISGINMLSNTVILASTTILALLLTVLGICYELNNQLSKEHYRHLLMIAKFDTIVIILSVASFVLFNLPIAEGDNVPEYWYTYIYYASIGVTSIIGASLIVVVIMLYTTISSMIKAIGLDKEHIFTDNDE